MSANLRRREADLTPEEQAKLAAFRARHSTPEARAREIADREAIRIEFPPAIKRYSPRIYPPNARNRVLIKQQILRNKRFVLMTDPAGRHYEEFVDNGDPGALHGAIQRAFLGTLGRPDEPGD